MAKEPETTSVDGCQLVWMQEHPDDYPTSDWAACGMTNKLGGSACSAICSINKVPGEQNTIEPGVSVSVTIVAGECANGESELIP